MLTASTWWGILVYHERSSTTDGAERRNPLRPARSRGHVARRGWDGGHHPARGGGAGGGLQAGALPPLRRQGDAALRFGCSVPRAARREDGRGRRRGRRGPV